MSAFAENEAGVKPSGKKMSDGELKAMLDAQKMSALASIWSTKLSGERDDALMYYMNDMSKDMPSMDGRSNAVSSDVADTIEGLMPSLMEIFAGSEEVVKFNPVGPEDVAAAEQETDYINHVFMHENPGFVVLYSFIKDALLSKVGIVKVWWEDKEEIEEETYHDLTDDEFDVILSDKGVEVIEHTEHPIDDPQLQAALMLSPPHSAVQDILDNKENKQAPGPGATPAPGAGPQGAASQGAGLASRPGSHPGAGQPPTLLGQPSQGPQAQVGGQGGAPGPAPAAQPQQPPTKSLHDVKIRRTAKVGRVKCLGVPPEEFGVEKTARSLRLHECNYCFHRSIVSVNRLLEQDYDEDIVNALPTYTAITMPEEINRDTVDEHQNVGTEHNPATRRVEVIEHYVRMDYEGNGRAELYKVDTGASEGQLLRKNGKVSLEKVDEFPFAAMTPIPMTHRFFGRSLADVVMEIQRIKTALLRAQLDNAYLANNPRVEVAESHASDNTLDDLLISRPGGVVRVKQPGGVNWQQIPTIGQHVFPLLEYQDSVREQRTGVSRQGQALDPEALQNVAASSANRMFSMVEARQKLVARIFAETGIRDLFILIHGFIRKHGTKAQTVRLRNQWVKIDPRDWKKRNDMTVEIGLGTGGKAEHVAMLQLIATYQQQAVAAGLTNLVTSENLYATATAVTRVAGHKDVDKFFTDPKTQPPPEPKMDPKLQIEMMKVQGAQQLEQAKIQHDQAREKAKFQADAALEQQKFQHERQMATIEMGMKREEHQLKLQHMNNEHQIKTADMGNQMLLAQHQAETKAQEGEQQIAIKQAELGMQHHKQEHDMKLADKQQAHEITMQGGKPSPGQKGPTILEEIRDNLKNPPSRKKIKIGRDSAGRMSHLEEI